MEQRDTQLDQVVPIAALLGYLNFSDGRPDPRWQKQLNEAYSWLAGHGEAKPWQALLEWLRAGLGRLEGTSAAFRDVTQADQVLTAVPRVLAAYRAAPCRSPRPSARRGAVPAVLPGPGLRGGAGSAGAPGRGERRRRHQCRCQPAQRFHRLPSHRHPGITAAGRTVRTRTAPACAGVPARRRRGLGAYHDLISRALEILNDTDPQLLAEAHFELPLLDELAIDVRAYDHGHPVNRRPNYVFGEWDPHQIDNSGRYRRYVVRKITLDALLDRVRAAATGHGRRAFARGSGRLGRDDPDGGRGQRQRPRGARFLGQPGHLAAPHRRLSRCLLRSVAAASVPGARGPHAPGTSPDAAALRRRPPAPQWLPGPPPGLAAAAALPGHPLRRHGLSRRQPASRPSAFPPSRAGC